VQWFRGTAQPRGLRARIREELARSGLGGDVEVSERLRSDLADMREQVDTTKRELDEARRELAAIQPVVEAGREAAATSGTSELASEYAKQADDHRAAWQQWRWGVLVA